MKFYPNLYAALSEIRRDLSKASLMTSTRVQQRVGQDLQAREILGYQYTIEEDGFPKTDEEVVALGVELKFPLFLRDPEKIQAWLFNERHIRRSGELNVLNELNHPALQTTIEGSWTSYTYGERLNGMISAMANTLEANNDSRRAFWPIFRPEDSLRAGAPTRIPCSLGYQALIRQTPEGPRLIFFYLQRSADFDSFFLTDIYLASDLQRHLSRQLGILPGQFVHSLISLHSFEVGNQEIY